MTLCGLIARIHQHESESEPYFIKAGTVDILRSAIKNRLMKSGVPILFDELNPGQARGTRPAHSIEDMKQMTEVFNSSCMNGRNSDIEFHALQPRIFTCNAYSPNGFFAALPLGVFEMTDSARAGLDSSVKAIFKRCLFCHIDRCIVPQNLRDAFKSERRSVKARIAQEIVGDIP
jgi:hypothetical protein